jgi:hypothetical protein
VNINWVSVKLLCFLICSKLNYVDLQFRTSCYHYMLRPEMVPVIPFPWLPDYEEFDESFDFSLFELDRELDDPPLLWWLYHRIPGYSLTWKTLTHHQWWSLYHLRPELFFSPWIPVACLRYWEAHHQRILQSLKSK